MTALPMLASNSAAFVVTFGVFIVALLTMTVIVVRWAIRSDRRGRDSWRQRQQSRVKPVDGDAPSRPGP